LIEFFGYTGSEQEERKKMQIDTPGRKNSPADSGTKKTRPGKEEAARKKKGFLVPLWLSLRPPWFSSWVRD
jgi:hypothetical protein